MLEEKGPGWANHGNDILNHRLCANGDIGAQCRRDASTSRIPYQSCKISVRYCIRRHSANVGTGYSASPGFRIGPYYEEALMRPHLTNAAGRASRKGAAPHRPTSRRAAHHEDQRRMGRAEESAPAAALHKVVDRDRSGMRIAPLDRDIRHPDRSTRRGDRHKIGRASCRERV